MRLQRSSLQRKEICRRGRLGELWLGVHSINGNSPESISGIPGDGIKLRKDISAALGFLELGQHVPD